MEQDIFYSKFKTRWADFDPNLHLRHTVYMDFCDQTRINFFESNGLGLRRLNELGYGPIVLRSEANYLQEVHMGEDITVYTRLAGLSEDYRKWRIIHDLTKHDDVPIAQVAVFGAWLDIRRRKISPPPPEAQDLMNKFTKDPSFKTI